MEKILFIVDDISAKGGTERVITKLANDLVDNSDLTVTIASYKQGAPFFKLDQRVIIRPFNAYSKLSRVLKAANEIKKNSHSIVVAVGMGVAFYTYLASILSFRNIPIVISEHWSSNAPHISIFWKIVRRLVYPRVASIVCLTKYDLNYYVAIGAKTKQIPNSISVPSTQPKYPLSHKVLISAGRLSWEKGFDEMVEIFYLSELWRSGWVLRIFGEGPEELKLRELALSLGISNYVELPGLTANIYSEFSYASVFLMTSHTEAMPMALLESQAFGLPCVVYNVTDTMSDIVQNNKNGFLVSNRSKEDFLNKLSLLAFDCYLRDEMSIEARRKSARYTNNSMALEYLSLFNELCVSNNEGTCK